MTEELEPRIATVGVHIVDTLGRPVSHLPSRQDSLRLEQIRLVPGGTAAGVAVDLATLGADVVSVGAVGADDAGAFLKSTMRRRGVDVSSVAALDGGATPASMLLVSENGDRPALHARGVNALTRWEDLDMTAAATCQAIHFGGMDAMSGLDIEQTVVRMSALRSAGRLVTLDFQSSARHLNPRLRTLLEETDIFLPNEEQAAGLVAMDNPRSAAQRLLDFGAKSVIITCGAEGAIYADREQSLHVPAHPVDVVDTTGCGDAFSAAFILATLKKYELSHALRVAAAAAGLVASGLGSDAALSGWQHLIEIAEH